MDAIPLCEITKVYTDIYFNTQQLLLDTTLFYTWRHVSAAHTAIFRPAYNQQIKRGIFKFRHLPF